MTFNRQARPKTRRIPRVVFGGLLVLIAAIVATLGSRLQASSPSSQDAPIDVSRGRGHAALGESLPNTMWPQHGQAAVQIGQSQIHAGPNQHAASIASL